MKRVLVVTDNIIIFENFESIRHELNIQDWEFHYYSSPTSAVVDKYPHLKVINVKKEIDFILENFDLVFSAHCQQIFPTELVNNIRCINIHPGLNPFNRGWYPQAFSCINKLPFGATIHEIDDEIDHGAIIDQIETVNYPWDTSLELYSRNVSNEKILIKKNLKSILDNTYTATLPKKEGNYNSKKDYYALRELDLKKQASYGEVINHLRGISHGNYKNAYFLTEEGEKVYVKIVLEKDE